MSLQHNAWKFKALSQRHHEKYYKTSLLGYAWSVALPFLTTNRNESRYDENFGVVGVHDATCSLNFNSVKLSAHIVTPGSKKGIKCLQVITKKVQQK